VRVLTTTLCYPTPDHPEQGIFVQRRAQALAKMNHVEVTVVSPQLWCPGLRPNYSYEDQSQPLPAKYPRMISVPIISRVTDGLSFARAIVKVIRAEQRAGRPIDLIDAHFVYPDGVGAWMAGKRLGIPVVVTVRGKIVSLSRCAVRRAQIREMLQQVNGIIAVCESLAKWVREITGEDLPVEVIPNGIDTATYHRVDKDRARSLLGWHPRAKYLLAVGHLQKLKGFDRLVKALPAVRRSCGDVRLVLAGSNRGEKSFQRDLFKLIDQHNHGSIEYVGARQADELNLMYNAADLTVNASRSEGWCNAISESLAVGTPVVAMDVGGNREQISSPEFGYIVPEEKVHALADTVTTALSRQWNHSLIAAHGGQRNWQQVANDVCVVFKRLCSLRSSISSTFSTHDLPTVEVTR